MKRRWSVILPLVGLLLFSIVTYDSVRSNGTFTGKRYFWWSAFRLDSDPLGKHSQPHQMEPCPDKDGDCVQFDPEEIWVNPGWIARLLIISGFPAFVASSFIRLGLGRLGISHVVTFFATTPPLIVVWFYFVGWLFDRRTLKRSRKEAAMAP